MYAFGNMSTMVSNIRKMLSLPLKVEMIEKEPKYDDRVWRRMRVALVFGLFRFSLNIVECKIEQISATKGISIFKVLAGR